MVKRGVITASVVLAAGCRTPARDPAPSETALASEAAGSSAAPAILTTVTGRALNAKGGPIVVDANGTRTWIDLPGEWPPSLVGQRVVVDGQLEKRAGLPLARGTEPLVQGIVGDYWVLTKVKYRQE